MRKLSVLASVLAAAVALAGVGVASSPQEGSATKPTMGILCLDVGGEARPPVCRGSSSRIDQGYDICICETAQRVETPVCGKGEKPPAEKRAYELARKDAARDGSLVGDTYEGRRMCVRARNG
jgi:hypothetical protein